MIGNFGFKAVTKSLSTLGLLRYWFLVLIFFGGLVKELAGMASPSLPLPTWRLHPKRRSDSPTRSVVAAATSEDHSLRRKLSSWNARIESLASLEARGISRVPLTERHEASTAQYRDMALIWISANLSANNLAVGLLGPLVFGLGFLDAALCAIFGVILGAAGSAYYSTWGPGSGLRSMV